MGDRPIYTKPIYAPPITAGPDPFYYTPVPNAWYYGPISPVILEETAPTSLVEAGLGEHQLATAKPGDAVPYVFGQTLVTPLIYTVMDNGGGYLLADYIISTGQCESIVSVILDGETLSVGSSPDVFNSWEFYLGTASQVASPLIEAAMGSPQNYDPLPNICHVVAKLGKANSPDVKFIVKGLLLDDPRTSPRLGSTASSNPALILSRVFTDAGYTVNDAALTIAANFCDESTGSPQLPRWSIDLPVYNRNSLRRWVHTIAAYGSLIVDVRGGEVFIVPDGKVTTSPQTDHTITIDDIQNPRTIWPGIGRVPKKVIVDYRETDGTKGVAEAGAGTAGNISRLRMPGYGTYSMAKRKAEEVLAKSNSIRHEHTAYDKALKTTPGDVGAITYAPHDLASKYFRLVDYRQTEIGAFRRTYSEYSDGHYDDGTYTPATPGTNPGTNPGVDPPGNIPVGPCPVITQETAPASAGGYERLKIEFVETNWVHVLDYLVVVGPSSGNWNGPGTVYFGIVPHTANGSQAIYTGPIAMPDAGASPQVAAVEYKAWVQIHGPTGYGVSCTTLYTPGLLLDNLAMWLAMDELSGTRYDSSDNAYAAIEWGGTVGYDSDGVINGAATFTAGNDPFRITLAAGPLLFPGNNDFTITCWVRMDNDDNNKGFVSTWSAGQGYLFWLRSTVDNIPALSINGTDETASPGSAASTRVDWSSAISINEWHFIYCYHDSVNDEIGISVDNAAPVTLAWAHGVDHTGSPNCYIGEYGNSASTCLNGSMDILTFHNKVLSSSELADLYNGGAGMEFPA